MVFGIGTRAKCGLESKGNRFVARRPASLEDKDFDALGKRRKAQAQGCGAGLYGCGLRTQKHEKRFALLGHQMQPSQTCRRSEEHTSELQSLMRNSNAVFCLKKKNTSKNQ